MERSLSVVVSSAFLILVFGSLTPLTAQKRSSAGEMIRQRMLNDIRSVKDQVDELNRTVNQLRNKVGLLQNQNQKRKNQIRDLKQQLEDIEDNYDQTTNTTETTSETTGSTSALSVWESRPDLTYQVRREPLAREVTHVTTDDTVLTELAHKYYRDSSYWLQIYEVNEDKLPSPDVVPPNVKLRLPSINELESP